MQKSVLAVFLVKEHKKYGFWKSSETLSVGCYGLLNNIAASLHLGFGDNERRCKADFVAVGGFGQQASFLEV